MESFEDTIQELRNENAEIKEKLNFLARELSKKGNSGHRIFCKKCEGCLSGKLCERSYCRNFVCEKCDNYSQGGITYFCCRHCKKR